MPDKDAASLRDVIFHQYAKLITRSAFKLSDSKEAKRLHYGFVRKKLRELMTGVISWSEILREDLQFVESEKKCIYCGSEENLHKEHLVPRSLKIKPECATCDKIQGIHNLVWACKTCNSLKGTKGLYEFFKSRYPEDKKFYDIIPSLAEKKYLKTIYSCHECAQILDKGDIDGDKKITVLDIDFILH
jgi:5-methylcytosine-specific restriction endonuclease McrA